MGICTDRDYFKPAPAKCQTGMNAQPQLLSVSLPFCFSLPSAYAESFVKVFL